MIILLGPQRLAPVVGEVAASYGVAGHAAVITAGWQEREAEDEELFAALGMPGVNLQLYARWEEVARTDPALFAAHRERQDRLRALEELYDGRLRHVMAAARELMRAEGPLGLIESERESAIDAVRELDDHHLRRVAAIHAEFDARVKPTEHPALARHREQIRDVLARSEVVAIAGGHVGVLLNRLRLFGLGDAIGDRHVIAWSAGAMVCCGRIALFHDSPPQGAGNAEVFEHGLGLCPDYVALPHAKRRLRMSDPVRVALMARRLAPATPLTLELRDHVALDGGRVVGAAGACALGHDGSVTPIRPAAAAGGAA
ncbi:MAG: Type 1 glutamine amidotransferase-like domain-containing protein [Deltaproteobacteria bacterium]|nr:Type 1 glutamine amidotransferase-like domain-containing protein [Deltaproteobacteria bacterium]